MSALNKFQTHCEKLINKLNTEHVNNIKNLSDDLSRIKYLYPLANELELELATWAPKNIERTEALKKTGNTLFQQRNFMHAISVYNEALLKCPQDFIEGQKLYDTIIGNRSAVFFELNQHTKVLKDVEALKQSGNHPTIHKLLIRGGKSCELLQKYASAKKYYLNALDKIKKSKDINEADKIKLINEIECKLIKLKEFNTKIDASDASDAINKEIQLIGGNLNYPALITKVSIKNNPQFGRYVIANEPIQVGEIIGIEEPFVCVVGADMYKTNCTHCLVSTNQPLFCKACTCACFCSLACKDAAKHYHKTECKILLSLYDTGVSVNCLMALRMITQNKFKLGTQINETNVVYKTNDASNVYKLVSHCEERSTPEFIHYSFMSIYLLRLLKFTNYFGKTGKDGVLSDDEAYIGSIILKNLQILQFNAHEIAEIQHNQSLDRNEAAYKSESVGAGLYPTFALFNHSCDPSLIRYNIGNRMVLRAIKPIKKGEGVYENYGPLYTLDVKEARQKKLKQLYMFDCMCKPCVEDWPLFNNIDGNTLRIQCQCGGIVVVDKDLVDPEYQCGKCNRRRNIMPTLKGLIPLEPKSVKSEQLIANKLYKEASEKIIDILDIYLKYLAPPFADMILLQQRLKMCLLHFGNKKYDYQSN